MKDSFSPLGEFLSFVWPKRKKPKKTPPCYRFFPALLTLLGVKRKLAKKIFGSNSRLPTPPNKIALLGAVEGD